jgi:hypothetical protein
MMIKQFLASIAFSILSACAPDSGSGTVFTPTAPPVAPPIPTQPAGPGTIPVNYKALIRTEAPVNGWPNKTYTAVGYCATINSSTFCWSDGLKTLTWTSNNFTYGPLYYNYWEVHTGSGGLAESCHGGCVDDFMTAPVLVTPQLLQRIPAQKIQDVFDQGGGGSLNCTVNGSTYDCGSVTFLGVI